MAITNRIYTTCMILFASLGCAACVKMNTVTPTGTIGAELPTIVSTQTAKSNSGSKAQAGILELSEEIPIANRMTDFVFRGDVLYFKTEANVTTWYRYNFNKREAELSPVQILTGEQLIEEVKQNTDRNPNLADFYPSLSYRKVLFAELQDSATPTHSSSGGFGASTALPTGTSALYEFSSFDPSSPLTYLLYVYDIDQKSIIDLGPFSGDIGSVLWSQDENLVLINRDSSLVMDTVSPFGNWLVNLKSKKITQILVKDPDRSEIIPLLISNDGAVFVYSHVNWQRDPGVQVANLLTGEFTQPPLYRMTRVWWLVDGKSFAYISPQDSRYESKIKGFDLLENKEIPSSGEIFSPDLLSSLLSVSESGKYIIYQSMNDGYIYVREISFGE